MNATKIIETIKVYNTMRLKYEKEKAAGSLFQLRKNFINELDSILDEELNKSDIDKLQQKSSKI